MTLSYAIIAMEIEGVEREVEAGYNFYPATKGMRDRIGAVLGAGPAMEPDEPAHVEVLSYKLNGEDIERELTVGQLKEIEEACLARELP